LLMDRLSSATQWSLVRGSQLAIVSRLPKVFLLGKRLGYTNPQRYSIPKGLCASGVSNAQVSSTL